MLRDLEVRVCVFRALAFAVLEFWCLCGLEGLSLESWRWGRLEIGKGSLEAMAAVSRLLRAGGILFGGLCNEAGSTSVTVLSLRNWQACVAEN